MIPNFALGLTSDGITLWHRSPDGWVRVGVVPMDSPDLDAGMRELSRKAKGLAAGPVRTKLVIPDDQILFCTLPKPDGSAEEASDAIRVQLEGLTPYPVAELDFDWVTDGAEVHIAVVAHETVIEAEDFATQHGLNPVMAVAAPTPDKLSQEPFFHATRFGRKLVPDLSARSFTRDMVIEVGEARLPDPERPAAPDQPTDTTTASASKAAAPDEQKQAASKAEAASAGTPPGPGKPATPKPELSKKPAAQPEPAAGSDAAAARKSALLSKLSAATLAQGVGAGMLTKLVRGKAAPAEDASPSAPKQTSADDPAATFKSRRSDTGKAADAATKPPTIEARGRDMAAKLLGFLKPATKDTLPGDTTPDTTAPSLKKTADAAPDPASSESTRTAQRKDPLETLRERGSSAAADSEAERLTIFGARNQEAMPAPGLPRGLLVLGGVGMLLAAVAIWAVYFYTTQPTPDQISITSEEPALPEQQAFTLPDTQDPASSELAEIEAALGVEDAAQQLPDEGEDMAPGATAGAEEDTLRLSAAEQSGRVAALRSIELLPPTEATPLPASPEPPAPFGSTPLPPLRSEVSPEAPAQSTEDAPAVAAPILPDGEDALDIAVAQGAPAATPPTRPDGLVSEEVLAALQAAREAAAEIPEPETPVAVQIDEDDLDVTVTPGQPSATPPARPDDIAPDDLDTEAETPAPADEDEARLLAPTPGAVTLNALRPASRPENIATAAPAPEDSFADASHLAVAASLRPDARPSQFAAIVQRSLRAAESVAPTPEAPVQTARAAVQAAPAIPTSASVAREATQARAINLRQINLIGVMGTQAARRALVRLSNGRVVTVRVGERLDGGQVTAIGDSELRYTRRGRDVVLRLAS